MLNAYYTNSDTKVAHATDLAELPQLVAGSAESVWIDLESPTDAELRAVGDAFGLTKDALEDCITGEQRPRIDEFEDHIFILLYGMVGANDAAGFTPRKLSAFLSDRYLITVHPDPLRTLREFRDRIKRQRATSLARGPDFILHGIMDAMVDRYLIVADAYEDRLDQLEERSLDPACNDSILAETADLRRDMLHLRRLASSQLELLLPIERGEYEDISSELGARFSHVRDHLKQVRDVIDGLRELLAGVRENYRATLADRLNSTMKTLTLFATVLLPLSLIAGIYGMNVPLWPPTDNPLSFYGVLGAMAITAVAMLLFVRRKRW